MENLQSRKLNAGETPDREKNIPAHADGSLELRNLRVGIAGLGGLGSNLAQMLARSGVRRLHLVDFDVVEPENLNRQIYKPTHIGMKKTQALRQELLSIAPETELSVTDARVTAQNAEEIFARDDILVEALDDPSAKAELVNALRASRPEAPLICASGMAGLHDANAIRTRRIGTNWYVVGDGAHGIETGERCYAPRVIICAAQMANVILRILTDLE